MSNANFLTFFSAVWHRTYNDPRIHLTVMFHHGSSDYRTFHIPIHSEATSIVFPDVDIENEGVNSDRKTHPLSHGVSNITSCSHPAGESEVGDGVNITTDSDSNVISCFGSANDTPTVKTEYTTGACHGGQRNLTDFMHWFEKMAPITLPSSSSNSSSNHTAQKLALKARTKSPTEGISDIASGSDRLNDTISIREGLLDPEAKSPTEGISDITPCFGSANYPIRINRTEPGHKEKPHDTWNVTFYISVSTTTLYGKGTVAFY